VSPVQAVDLVVQGLVAMPLAVAARAGLVVELVLGLAQALAVAKGQAARVAAMSAFDFVAAESTLWRSGRQGYRSASSFPRRPWSRRSSALVGRA
jgi:hypothetical protein